MFDWIVFLKSAGSSFGRSGLGGLANLLNCFFVFDVNRLKSFSISLGLALFAVGMKDSPLFRRMICVLDNGVSDRLTMLDCAHE